jgi:hypothetical protein
MKQYYVKWILTEDSMAREKRLQCERASREFVMPGKKGGTMVFHWLAIDGSLDGFLLRTLVFKHELPDIWEDTPNSHKLFDSFHNKWDIHYLLNPNN